VSRACPVGGCNGHCQSYVVTRGIMAVTEISSYVKAVREIVPDHLTDDVAEVLLRYLRVAEEALTDYQAHVGTPHVAEFLEAAEWWERRAMK
jgi:hypothetical protein